MLMIIDRKDLVVRFQDGVIRVYRDDELVQRTGVKLLEMLVVYGNPLVESSVWRALSEQGVPAVILPTRGQQPPAILAEGLAAQLPARRLQYRCAENAGQATALARWLLARKFLSYRLPFKTLQPHLQAELAEGFMATLRQQLAKLHQASNIDTFLGIEGQLSREWFQLLAAALPEQWKFTGRNRQPPQDPLNALLSLAYTLALTDIRQMVITEGFDPAFGFLHQPYPARHALALDVLEIFRSGVDLFALNVLAIMTPEHFYYREKEGCRLSKEARQIFYREWAIYRKSWPRPLKKQNLQDAGFLQEIARGQVQQLRKTMEYITEDDASLAPEDDSFEDY